MNNAEIGKAMVIKLDPVLPEYPTFKEGVRRAPKRELTLNKREIKLAVANALRYVPEELHEQLAPEFLDELLTRGRIYGYRFMPKERIYGRPIDEYKGKCVEGKAFQVMIDNNLDHDVALYPYELVTYGETGQVCQNWMQYQLIKRYLEELTDEHTLVMMSGHPMGLFKSPQDQPPCHRDQRPDGGNVRQPGGLGKGHSHGRILLWTDDSRRLDVHRPAGHRARNL